ncbi:hypothetical protein HDV00_009690 [Rhizophlyctis rosea]|nr:hypothetical protein HDV00_009690 [Rhizophlyctis rosea]
MSWDYSSQGTFGNDKTTLWMGDLEPWMDENYIKQLCVEVYFICCSANYRLNLCCSANYRLNLSVPLHDRYSLGEHVNVKMIRDRMSGGLAGYCFIDFQNNQAALKHLTTINGTLIPGTNRVFKLNWASGGGLGNPAAGMDRGPEYSIFVGDLDPTVTDFMLFQLFSAQYATCKSAKVVTDPNTGQPRGYGFVRFWDENEANRAITEMQSVICGSRPMRISVATPKTRPAGTMSNPMQQLPPQQTAYYAQQAPMGGALPPDYDPFNDPTNTTVFVGGLIAPISDEELRQYFSHYGEIVYTKVPPGKGCGFVQFAHRQSAEMAIQQMHGFYVGGSRVRLSWGRSQAVPKNEFARGGSSSLELTPVTPGGPLSAGVSPYGAAPPVGGMAAPMQYPGAPTAAPVQPPVLEDPRVPEPIEKVNDAYIKKREDELVKTELEVGWREVS